LCDVISAVAEFMVRMHVLMGVLQWCGMGYGDQYR
jgi:hypothetical protein